MRVLGGKLFSLSSNQGAKISDVWGEKSCEYNYFHAGKYGELLKNLLVVKPNLLDKGSELLSSWWWS